MEFEKDDTGKYLGDGNSIMVCFFFSVLRINDICDQIIENTKAAGLKGHFNVHITSLTRI